MKRLFIALIFAGALAACNEGSDSVTIKIDSTTDDKIEEKLDNLGDKIEQKAGQVWDSTKSKAKDLKDGVEINVRTGKDSVKK